MRDYPDAGPAGGDRTVEATTEGVARNMAIAQRFGGGDANGTAATSILHVQAGTAGDRLSMPRKPPQQNFAGVV